MLMLGFPAPHWIRKGSQRFKEPAELNMAYGHYSVYLRVADTPLSR